MCTKAEYICNPDSALHSTTIASLLYNHYILLSNMSRPLLSYFHLVYFHIFSTKPLSRSSSLIRPLLTPVPTHSIHVT